jgi:NitT/TauT family transport system permease protein
MRRRLAAHAPSIALFAALLILWQLAATSFGIREYILPGPVAVLRALGSGEIPWLAHAWTTALEIVGAFLVAGAAGVALGVAIAWSPVASSALVPFLVFVNTLPKVAVAPLFLLWLGYGILPNMLIGALIGFFPVVINTAVGLTQVDPEMLDLGRVFSAPKWKVFVKIRIPNAYPYILSALKVTATAAVVGAIVREFLYGGLAQAVDSWEPRDTIPPHSLFGGHHGRISRSPGVPGARRNSGRRRHWGTVRPHLTRRRRSRQSPRRGGRAVEYRDTVRVAVDSG